VFRQHPVSAASPDRSSAGIARCFDNAPYIFGLASDQNLPVRLGKQTRAEKAMFMTAIGKCSAVHPHHAAGMTCANDLQSIFPQVAGHYLVFQQRTRTLFHFQSAAGYRLFVSLTVLTSSDILGLVTSTGHAWAEASSSGDVSQRNRHRH
jgi:hypothetical protein